jgi:hypothetical protein
MPYSGSQITRLGLSATTRGLFSAFSKAAVPLGTPTILMPEDAATGVSLVHVLRLLADDFVGASSHAFGRWQIATAGTFAADEIVFDTQLRESDDHIVYDDSVEVFPENLDVSPSTVYYVRFQRESLLSTSSWSSTISFTFEAAKLTAARWRKGQ